jgi:hypothetical protein
LNIFATNKSPKITAQEHCDRHLVKMIVETAQMLSCAHWILDNKIVGYKPTHWNHPCSSWIRESSENYLWAYSLLSELCAEYTLRYSKSHKTELLLPALSKAPKNTPEGDLTPWAQAMPEEFQQEDSIKAYQKYLLGKYEEWLTRPRPLGVCWTNQQLPSWLAGQFRAETVYPSDGRVTMRLTEKITRRAG